MKVLIIALSIALSACTGNKAGFETGQDTYSKPVVITIIDINEVPPVVTPCIKHKNKCKNPNHKKGHKKGKGHKKAKGKGHHKGKH